MDKPSAEAAFSLKRTSDGAAVSGSFGWYGNALIFSPRTPLAGATSYTAKVDATAKDTAGNPLDAPKSLAVHDCHPADCFLSGRPPTARSLVVPRCTPSLTRRWTSPPPRLPSR